eukprot:scaffold63165_cov69-Phaeocystis_antarctica.AAC.5
MLPLEACPREAVYQHRLQLLRRGLRGEAACVEPVARARRVAGRRLALHEHAPLVRVAAK